jgi:hypothetical protein
MWGWPLEPIDEQYRREIIGPTDHVYVVAFVPFDGYDSERDVLLYTKMFRNFTGRIANPYDIARPELLEALPHVVQARQHLAALDYLSASTPVEWHIGIEQNANDLRLLLNGAAKIPEQRLRVVYTRFVGEAG